MKWNATKIQGDEQNLIEFDYIESKNGQLTFIKENNQIKKIEENIFAFQARVFLEKFEDFAKVKDESEKNTAYPYYDSEGIPTIGYGFNLAVSSICELLENKLQFIGGEEKREWRYYTELAGHFKFDKPKPKEDKYVLRQPEVFKQDEHKDDWKNIVKNLDKNYQENRNNPIPKEIILNKEEINQNKKYLTSILQKYFPFTMSKENSQSFLASLIDERKYRLEAIYKEDFNLNENKKFDSYEQLALLSLFYNRESLVKKESDIGRAIQENNRFKVWFEIRYRSNGGKSKGIAKRRFAESNIFGLFDGVERGGFDNTAEWSKKHTPTLQEAIEFMKFLYSPFRKEYDARVKENGQTKLIKKTTNNYIDYIKAYETEMVFEGITLDEYDDSDFKNHYVSHTDFIKICTKVIASTIVKTIETSLVKLFSVFSQPLFHPNTSTPNITATESIKIALNPINKRLNQIRSNASLPNEVFFISTGLYTPKGSIDNQGLVTHILLDTSSHFDCDSFIHPQNIIFYIVLCDRLGLNAKIIKLEGCPKALVEVKDYQIGMIEKKFNGLIQINEKEGVIYCFEKEADGKNSPNLTIYDSFSSTPLVTIFNLRSEGNSNA